MSLIQEALRRKEEEEGRGHLTALDPALPAPAALTPESGRKAVWVSIMRGLCYLVLFAGAGAGLVALYRSAGPGPASDPVAASPAVEKPAVAPAAKPDPIAAPALVAVPAPKPVQGTGAKPTAEAKPVPAPVSTARPTPRPPVEETIPPGAWPELHVMGVFARPSPEDSSAVIDGELEDVGAKIRGVQLVDVKQNGVTFRFRGEDKFVRVGKTTLK